MRSRAWAQLLIVNSSLLITQCGTPDIGSGDGKGVVRRVDRDHKMITLDHGKIGDLVEPMTMAYPIDAIDKVNEILPNDTVSFTLKENPPGNFVITSITKIGVASDTVSHPAK
jgi:Cu/Ag efflux protein CusF